MQLERLHRESYGWARRCCTGHPDDAADVLQTAYLKILEGRARYDGTAAFKTWLFAVIRNTAADARRRRGRRLRLMRAAPMPSADEAAPPDQPHRQGAFRQALAALSERQREVLLLVLYHDLTVEEAARVMGVALGTARTHYDRGKKQLRKLLERAGVLDASAHQR